MTLPEWWIERGIGETRFALVEHGEIVEARIDLEGAAPAGTVLEARLRQAAKPAIAVTGGVEYLLPKGAPGVTEGAALNIEVTRQAIPGSEPWKRPLARATGEEARETPPFAGRDLAFPAPRDALAEAGWNDLIEEARSGVLRFAGGELRIAATPAMTLIDVDGFLPPDELAVLGAGEAAKAVRRLDIGGSIGIDLPTAGSRLVRQAAAEAIDDRLEQPFERTAVNGFGFIQIVRPRRRASLIELAQDRAAFEARVLLRRAAFERSGGKNLVAYPAVIAVLDARPAWIEALSRQVGGAVGLRAGANLPISASHVENS